MNTTTPDHHHDQTCRRCCWLHPNDLAHNLTIEKASRGSVFQLTGACSNVTVCKGARKAGHPLVWTTRHHHLIALDCEFAIKPPSQVAN